MAVIIPSMSNMVFPEVMTGINQILEETDLQPVVGLTDYLPEKEEKVLYEMLSWRPSGVIIAGLEHSDAQPRDAARLGHSRGRDHGCGRHAGRFRGGHFASPRGQQMAQAIIKAGYRRIGFMGTKMPLDHRARKRFEGFTEALAKAGVEIADQEFYSGGSALVKGREMTQDAAGTHARPGFPLLLE